MARWGTALGLLIGIGQVWAAITEPPPIESIWMGLIAAAILGFIVFVIGLIAPTFMGLATVGAIIGWLIAGIIYAVRTEWASAITVFAIAGCVFIAHLGFVAVQGRREARWNSPRRL